MSFLLGLWPHDLDFLALPGVWPGSNDRKCKLYGVQSSEAPHGGNVAIETLGHTARSQFNKEYKFFFAFSCSACMPQVVCQP